MILYVVSVSVALVIALAVYLTAPKNKTNVFFALFVLAVALWLLGVFLPLVPDRSITLLFRFVFACSIMMALMMHYFIIYLVNDEAAKGWRFRVLIPSMIAISATFTPLVIESATKVQAGSSIVIRPTRNVLYPLVMFWILVIVTTSLLRMYRHYRSIELSSKKNQLRLIFLALLAASAIAITTNVLLPNITKDTTFNSYAPVSLVVLAAITGYSILKHRFLNIRIFVARSIAYLLTLLLLGAIAAATLFTASTYLIGGLAGTQAELWTLTVTTMGVAFLFQPLKIFFDKGTKSIFLRDAYDTQDVIDQLSSLLATEISLRTIVSKGADLIESSLRPLHLRFVVFKDGESYIDESRSNKNQRAVNRLEVDSFEGILIVRDEASEKEGEYLDLYDADMLLKLRTNEETVGALLLGPKQSGTIYTKQDIDLLTISEKELAIAIQNARYFEQIQEFNIKLQKEVDQATAELRANNEKLKALDEAKDEFVSMASHQLRTPLTSVKGYISMVIEGDAGKLKPEQQRLLEEAFGSSQRMVYLIADLLNVSRLKTGKFIIEPKEIHLPDIVEQEVQQLKPTAEARKLTLNFEKPRRFPKIWLDETKIRQVVMNFIDNAIYYTPAGGQIEITLTSKRDAIEFKVKDTGIGVPKKEQPKLFTKFFRAGNARKARPDGTGLGLYMAQRVVSAQSGTIISESEEGKGSTFGFAFPLKKIREKPNKPVRLKTERHQSESIG